MLISFLVSLLTAAAPSSAGLKNRPYEVQSYRIEMTLSEDGSFKNKLVSRIRTTKATNEIELDAYDLTVEFALADGKPATPSPKYDPESRTGTLTLKTGPLPANKDVVVELSYSGKASDQQEGFFRLKEAQDDKLLPFYFTNFRPRFAQRFFPHNGQPQDTATFELFATVDSRYTVVSNGVKTKDEVFQEGGKNLRRVEWKLEKPHAPHLVGIAIGQFEAVPVNDEIPSTMWVAPGRKERTWVVSNELKGLWNFQVGLTGTKYGWPKLDVVSLPRFFLSSTENTSLLFMRESNATVEVKNDQLARALVTQRLSRAMANQWFGNLVTARSWDDAWLNDGLSTYLAEATFDDLNGNEQVEIERTVSAIEDLFRHDEGPRGHALVTKGATAAEISDEITNRKGAAVTRMLEQWLGPKELKAGFKAYLEKYAYQSATTDDFFRVVLETNKKDKDKDLKGFQATWSTKRGAPVVFPEFSFGGSQITVTIRQQNSVSSEKGPFVFRLPIVVHRENEPQYTIKKTILVDKPEVKVSFDVPATPQWVNWNEDFGALVRINKASVSEDQWVDAVRYDPDPTWRLVAAWNLLGEIANPQMEAETRPTDNALNAILDLLAKDPSPYVREAVLKRMANTRFKRLPRDFAAVGLALAKKPENLNEDPLGSIRVRCAALEMLGKTDAPEGHQYILDQLGKRDLDINYLGAFAGAAARINTPAALATLKSAMVTHKSRGEAYFRKAAEALGSVEGPEVIAPIRELLTSNASNPELVRLVFERLSKNKTLRENPDFAPLITSLVLSEAFAAEQMRALMVAALDDVKSPIAKDALHEIEAKTKSEQLRRAARKIREANFPPLPQTPKEKPRR